jgi:hypothetical protein
LVMSCAIALLLCVPRPTPIDPEWNEVWNEEPLPDAQVYEAWLDLADAMDEKLP